MGGIFHCPAGFGSLSEPRESCAVGALVFRCLPDPHREIDPASSNGVERPLNRQGSETTVPVSTRTPLPKISDHTRRWIVVDADGKVLGRLATLVARHLTGKTKAVYTPFLDTGDFVVVVNAEKIALTGSKMQNKVYRRHTGFPGGMKTVEVAKLRASRPERVIEEAVKGMLPKTKLGKKMFKKLKVYAGPHHPHTAQAPAAVAV